MKTKILDIILNEYFKEGNCYYFFTSEIMDKAKISFKQASEVLNELEKNGILTVSFDLVCPEENCDRIIYDYSNISHEKTKNLLESDQNILCDNCGIEFKPEKEHFQFHYLPNKKYFELYEEERRTSNAR
jgi:hypothetical protein